MFVLDADRHVLEPSDLWETPDRDDRSARATAARSEQAVAQLTSIPAEVHGLDDRGALRVGAAADLLLIDRDLLATSTPHLVSDFPAGSSRYVADATGYPAVVVNGEVVLEDGQPTGALPGQIL